MIIDVLLKYFYRDVYDIECCKRGCNCPDAKFPECDEANNPKMSTHDILAKLFKPQGEELKSGSMEVDGQKLSPEKKSMFSQALKSAIEGLENVLNS